MRRGATLRARSTSKCLKVSLRSYSSKLNEGQDAATSAGVDPNGSEVEVQDTVDADIGRKAHTSKDHGNGDPKYPRPGLPLSPLMDPVYQAAKQRYRLPKAPPSENPTPFQQQLARNPYGTIPKPLSSHEPS
jgi:hypothetical protein